MDPSPSHAVGSAPLVDAALSRLAELDTRSLPEHAAVYEQIHTDLRRALDSDAREAGSAETHLTASPDVSSRG